MAKKSLYKVVFVNQGKVYEIYARHVGQGDLYGFIEVKDLVFGTRSRVVVDPAEEKLRSEFDGVRATYVPIHAVVRIDRVEREGTAKIIPFGERVHNDAGAATAFSTLAVPPRPNKKD